jgi:hypothetical protein
MRVCLGCSCPAPQPAAPPVSGPASLPPNQPSARHGCSPAHWLYDSGGVPWRCGVPEARVLCVWLGVGLSLHCCVRGVNCFPLGGASSSIPWAQAKLHGERFVFCSGLVLALSVSCWHSPKHLAAT